MPKFHCRLLIAVFWLCVVLSTIQPSPHLLGVDGFLPRPSHNEKEHCPHGLLLPSFSKRQRQGGNCFILTSSATPSPPDAILDGDTDDNDNSNTATDTAENGSSLSTISDPEANVDNTTQTLSTSSSSPTLLSSLFSSKSNNDEPITQDPSDQLYSASDWLHNIQSLPGSLILRAIRGPVLAVTAWALVVSIVHAVLRQRFPTAAARLCLSDKPHSFLASALGLLLVFRTNSAYQRFAEARAIWERILSVSRNFSRMALLFEKDLGTDRLQRILRLLATFPYLLDDHIIANEPDVQEQAQLKVFYDQSSSSSSSSSSNNDFEGTSGSGTSSGNDDSTRTIPDVLAVARNVYQRERGSNRRTVGSVEIQYIDTRQLPWCLLPSLTRQRVAVAENRPLYICDRLAREVYGCRLTPNFTHRERATLLAMVDTLTSSIGVCEKIHQTAVPLNYARHALRCVSLWLFTLPMALVEDLGLATAPVVMCLAWGYFGIYQIGFTIEDPFQSALRLDSLCDAIYRNVMFGTSSMRRRMTALYKRSDEETDADWRNLPLPPMPGLPGANTTSYSS